MASREGRLRTGEGKRKRQETGMYAASGLRAFPVCHVP